MFYWSCPALLLKLGLPLQSEVDQRLPGAAGLRPVHLAVHVQAHLASVGMRPEPADGEAGALRESPHLAHLPRLAVPDGPADRLECPRPRDLQRDS